MQIQSSAAAGTSDAEGSWYSAGVTGKLTGLVAISARRLLAPRRELGSVVSGRLLVRSPPPATAPDDLAQAAASRG